MAEGVRPTVTCMECRTLLAGTTYLRIGVKVTDKGSSTICLTCVDKLLVGQENVRAMVKWYIDSHRVDTVASLKARIVEMERMMEELTRPEK